MSKGEPKKKLKIGTRTDRYGMNPTLPKAPWEDDDSASQTAEVSDEAGQ